MSIPQFRDGIRLTVELPRKSFRRYSGSARTITFPRQTRQAQRKIAFKAGSGIHEIKLQRRSQARSSKNIIYFQGFIFHFSDLSAALAGVALSPQITIFNTVLRKTV
jgi:hypothetical protein